MQRGIKSLQGSLSITKIPKAPRKPDNGDSSSKIDVNSDDDTHVLDSEDENDKAIVEVLSRGPGNQNCTSEDKPKSNDSTERENSNDSQKQDSNDSQKQNSNDSENQNRRNEPLVLTTDEKLPSEEAFERKSVEEVTSDASTTSREPERSRDTSLEPPTENANLQPGDRIEKKINLLKNYRHQRPGNRPPTESSLSQLERTASVLNKEGMPDFRRNLDDITQSYSPTNEEKSVKSKKKKSPTKSDSESQDKIIPSMSHSVSSMLGPSGSGRKDMAQNMAPVAPIENSGLLRSRVSHEPPIGILPTTQSVPQSHLSLNMSHGTLLTAGSPTPAVSEIKAPVPSMPIPHPHPSSAVPPHPMVAPSQGYPANLPPEGYGQYPPGNS